MAQTTTDTSASTVSGAGAASSFSGGTGTEAEFGSLGALSPTWWEPEDGSEPEPWLTPDQAFERFFEWTSDRGIELWDHQEEALMDLAAGDHVILGTPTGSGKSLVALGMLFMGMAQGKRCYYTAPIKALVSEKFFDLVQVLGRDNVGMITGDTHINTKAPVICCTAEILANDALREGEGADVGCVAMDEFHYFADPDRGWAWQVPLLTLPHTQFMLMSATLGDVTAIAASLEEHTGATCDLVVDAPRPVPLSYDYVTTSLEGTVELAMRGGEAPLYIVHFSQDAALATAQSLANFGIASKEQREAIKEAAKGTSFSTAFGKILKRLLGCGVGVHHAGMLPRYRLLVERLAQQGLLPVICGTDTLGVGINVPIHTVVLTALTKFDGYKMRRLRAREFHQIAGRAGRSGFDTEGMVIAEAPEHEIENAKLMAKAGDDPKKLRKIKKKKAPEGFVTWNKQTFERLIETQPETLKPRLRITHSMVISVVEQGSDARARVHDLIETSLQTPEEKTKLEVRADEIFATLIDSGVVVRTEVPPAPDAPTDAAPDIDYALTVDLPEDFALDQPLSPFLLAALELLDPESETYTMDLISMVEATLEDPKQVLRAQERAARDRAMAEMKADGIEYEERLERIQDVTYEKPLEDLLDAAFDKYCQEVPWANDYQLSPKSVLRDMLESASDFKGYIQKLGIARSEGILLRYLAEAYRSLDRTVPIEKRDERLRDIIFLGGRSDYSPEEVSLLGVPYVCCSYTNSYGTLPPESYSSVSIADEQEAYRAVSELYKNGHRRIAVLSAAPDDSSISQLRYLGYQRALRDFGLTEHPENLICAEDFTIANAYAAMQKRLRSPADFTAVFAIADDMAIGAMRALRESGRSIPEDCSVIAIDGISVSEYIHPMLTTLCQPMTAMGEASVEILLDIIEGRGVHRHVTLPTALREGASVRQLKH